MDNKSSKPAELSINDPSVEGWKLVPVEPTDRMLGAGLRWFDCMGNMPRAWKDMLSAAPTPPSAPVQQSVREALQLLHEHAQLYLPNYNDRQNVYDTVTSALSTSPLLDKNDQTEGEAELRWVVCGKVYGRPTATDALEWANDLLSVDGEIEHCRDDVRVKDMVNVAELLTQPDSNELVEAREELISAAELVCSTLEHPTKPVDALQMWRLRDALTVLHALAQSPSVGQKGG
jgi:hypothetical protein